MFYHYHCALLTPKVSVLSNTYSSPMQSHVSCQANLSKL